MQTKDDKTNFTVIRTRLGMESAGISILIGALAIFLALISFHQSDLNVRLDTPGGVHNILGVVGTHLADLLFYLFGVLAYELTGFLAWAGLRITIGRTFKLNARDWGILGLHLLSLAVVIHALFWPTRFMGHQVAGLLGRVPGNLLIILFSRVGAVILGLATAVISVLYVARISIVELTRNLWFALVRKFGRRHADVATAAEVVTTALESGTFASMEHTTFEHSTTATEPQRHAEPVGVLTSELTASGGQATATEKPNFDANEQQAEPFNDVPVITKPGSKPEPDVEASGAGNTSVSPRAKAASQGPTGAGPVIKQRFVQTELPNIGGSLGPAEAGYELPPLSLLEYVPQPVSQMDEETYKENAETLEKKLRNYKVDGRVTEIHPGPVVTMYEFKPAPGIKISQVANLSDDLAMALHALSVRIVAPLPGKGVIGVEVPNEKRETVYLRDVLGSDAFRKSKGKLTMALGKDIVGKPVVTNLAKLPHLLISGATGSGKSVSLNGMLLSILYKATPEDVRIILVDPKVVELQIFEGIPHLLLPVIYDAKHAAQALKWAVGEMERRYELLAKYGVRNIDSFNKLVVKAEEGEDISYNPNHQVSDISELKHMPAIVIVVDEFADLMMVASKEVEASITRLAQKARAAGIHLIMATQRPSKDVVTGLIKANFLARISFRVSSKVDSRIVLDQNGAESLLGYGDMLFMRPGTSILQRVHGAYTSEDDVKRVTNAWRAQGEPNYEMDILRSEEDEGGIDPKELDPLIEEAREIVIESGRASISYLQRRMKIGYNRAARMMEQLEKLGVVGPPDHKGEREILNQI